MKWCLTVMDMTFTYVSSCPSTAEKLVVLFCLLWPFVAVSMMSSRAKSASPVAAVIAVLGVSAAGAWLELGRVAWGRAISGGGSASASAGVAESLMLFFLGACFAVVVIVFAAFRRHRPIVDRVTAILVILFLANAVGALFAGATLVERVIPMELLYAGAIFAGGLAAGAIAWTFLTGRGRVASIALPHGATVVAILIVTWSVIVWQLAHEYVDIAMGR